MIDDFYKKFKIKDYLESEIKRNPGKNIDCTLGTNPFINKRIIKKNIKKAKSIINMYPIGKYEKLKIEILKLYKGNVNINEKNIAFGSGTMGIIRNLFEFLINDNTKVLGITPQFTRVTSEIELKKGIYEYYELNKENNYKFIANEFIKKINNQYSVIYIDNPNNPTGQIINIKDIEEIVKKANEYGIITIIDEAYGDYMNSSNSCINLIGKYKNIIVLKSASKFYGLPNHRIGYVIANQEIIKVYNETSIPFPFSDLSANIFINLLKEKKKIDKTKNKVIKVNEKIYKELGEEKYLYTSVETPIFTLKVKNKDLEFELRKRNILTESGENYINLDNSYVRIRINKKYRKLIKAIKEIEG